MFATRESRIHQDWNTRMNHASRANDGLHSSFRHYFTPDVYEFTKPQIRTARPVGNRLDVEVGARDPRFSDPKRELKWNNRAAVLASRNNANIHSCQRDFFDAPRILHRDGSSSARFPRQQNVPLLAMPQETVHDALMLLPKPGSVLGVHSARSYIDGGNIKHFSWKKEDGPRPRTSAAGSKPRRGRRRGAASRASARSTVSRSTNASFARSMRQLNRPQWDERFIHSHSATSDSLYHRAPRPEMALDMTGRDSNW